MAPTGSTRVSRLIGAPRAAVYAALTDADAVARWLPPRGMSGRVHAFDPRPGGAFSMSLTYDGTDPAARGKTSDHTDTVEGRFVELVPGERVVQAAVFRSDDPALAGEMTITWSLADAPEGTRVTALCENIPPGIPLEDNEAGSASSLENLAAYLGARG